MKITKSGEFFKQDRMLTYKEVANLLGVNTQTVRVWNMKKNRAKYNFAPSYIIGGRVKFKFKDIQEYIENQNRDLI